MLNVPYTLRDTPFSLERHTGTCNHVIKDGTATAAGAGDSLYEANPSVTGEKVKITLTLEQLSAEEPAAVSQVPRVLFFTANLYASSL